MRKDSSMLVLSRRLDETIVFPGINATVRVLEIRKGNVRLGIDAPAEVNILRGELPDKKAEWGTAAKEADVTANAKKTSEADEMLDNDLRDANMLLGIARLQLRVGLPQGAEEALAQASRQLEALRERLGKAPKSPPPVKPNRKPKALLVEDNANERELLAQFLRNAGMDVDTADDGAVALDYLSSRHMPDVVLMDMGLPRCDGLTAIREIRRNPRTAGLTVFAVTGHLPEDFDFRDTSRGVDAWFSKPINPENLVQRLNKELEGSLLK
jgi:carbon storage regulator CsrA